MREPLLIVGAGVMGAVLGRYAQRHGLQVVWFDDARPGAGTPASAGLMHAPWSPLAPDAYRKALDVLAEVSRTGLHWVEFPKQGSIPFVSPRLLQVPAERERVLSVQKGTLLTERGVSYTGTVVIAAGVWSGVLAHNLCAPIQSLAGSAFLWQGAPLQPLLQPWAPYKQLLAFERDLGWTWAGDDSAILAQNYSLVRERESLARCAAAVDRGTWSAHVIQGYRPTIRGQKTGLCVRIAPHTWVLTAGGKSSTILAGHYAPRIVFPRRSTTE